MHCSELTTTVTLPISCSERVREKAIMTKGTNEQTRNVGGICKIKIYDRAKNASTNTQQEIGRTGNRHHCNFNMIEYVSKL